MGIKVYNIIAISFFAINLGDHKRTIIFSRGATSNKKLQLRCIITVPSPSALHGYESTDIAKQLFR